MPRPPDEPSPAGDLRRVAAVGPFFGLRTEASADGPGGEGYRPLADCHGPRDPAAPLAGRVTAVAERLGTEERRVAGALVFQGLAARLWSIALGSAVLCGRMPSLAPERVWWHPDRMAPDDLWLPEPVAPPVADPESAGQSEAAVDDGRLAPLHGAIRSLCHVSQRLLCGKAGSALAGSLRLPHGWCRTHGRPDPAHRALELAERLLIRRPLHGTGTVRAASGDPDPAFTRRGCCLYYRVPGGGAVRRLRAPAAGIAPAQAPLGTEGADSPASSRSSTSPASWRARSWSSARAM
ncbi:(2Fe-2S)-binding protein [Streptantibioticus ferralitis]|uniref:(2Fe-2S)-binding protein n=1 Tax=Streptantibioticus ferralitis TaxID=236510 RepID=A0ABT5YT54_9ACTN|nr:(2Fe-2S)-binding protein [Streptantibioticus ferralitis]MDF2254782.1 (2Fe-2S)-binding protein [Streptantibioticus ferralitis]